MRLFASVVTVVALCGACREREPSPKELEVQLAQAKARQAEAEAEKAAIEARAGNIAVPTPGPNPFTKTKEDVAQLDVKKFAYEAFGEWSQAHPDKACPDKIEDLSTYMDTKSTNDPWGHPYRMFCGQNLPAGAKGGLAVMSFGPDGQDGTADDIKSW
jgi:hypothetical protein